MRLPTSIDGETRSHDALSAVLPKLEGVRKAGSGWTARCPAHDDHTPSLSVSVGRDGRVLLKCFSGCPVESITAAMGLKMSDLFSDDPSPPRPVHTTATKPLVLPELSAGDPIDWWRLATLRGIDPDGVRLAVERGLVHFATIYDRDCWVVTDSRRIAAQARRMDGQPWGDGRKAHTLKGSVGNWPVGLPEAEPFCTILLVEGGPDLLAACHYIVREHQSNYTAPIAMLGSSMNIPPEALPMFKNTWTRIFPHADKAGRQAGVRWARALAPYVGTVDLYDLTDAGDGINDLNDLAASGYAGRMIP